MYYLKSSKRFFALFGIATLFDILVGKATFGATLDTINFDVIVNNKIVGQVGASSRVNAENEGGIFADFTATGRTLEQLYTHLGLGSQGHLNWFQIIIDTNFPNLDIQGNPLTVPYIDPPKGGTLNLWADNVPWYLNESAKPSADTRSEIPELQLDSQSFGSVLGYEDFPFGSVGRYVSFKTFLVADFGNQTYDVLGGFSWQVESNQPKEPFTDTNGNGIWDAGEPFTDTNGNGVLDGLTEVTALQSRAVFTSAYADQIETEFGYTKVLKLPTYKFSKTLSAGTVNSFSKSGLLPSTPFISWTDNLPNTNPSGTPDTILGTFNSSGKPINSNDNGGPLGNNLGSGLSGSVNGNGTIKLKVSGAPDSNFDGVYQETVCNGGSGGGGCSIVNKQHPQSGKYQTLIKLYEDSFPATGNNVGINGRAIAARTVDQDLLIWDTDRSKSSPTPVKVPEPIPALGLLVLGIWGTFQGLKIIKDKQ
ncbi:MAG TPA: hypothetical protein DCY91_18260 [Cyanobacteria bacterium UBA11370]|nr:hypothetical protein [Cyanobacteria bacterium UBA11370]HBY76310.1 hypothetical protein [Cyanobacteria bacterium UBA11148]